MTPCKEFSGYKNRDGYGVKRFEGKVQKSHRVAWQRAYGWIPEGQVVMHLCDNPACVRLSHLRLGTVQENVADRDRKGRRSPPKGEMNGKAVLTAANVRYIRSFRRTPGIQTRLAMEFNVSKAAINEVRTKNRNWTHV